MECEDCQNESINYSNKYCEICAGMMKPKKKPDGESQSIKCES